MEAEHTGTPEQLKLPMSAINHSDIGRLAREAETIDNFLRQAALKGSNTPAQLPQTSRLFDEIVSINKLNMLKEADRGSLYKTLQAVRTKAPVIHMSFSTDPSPVFLERLMTWLRQNIHPYVLLQTGLLPNIGAGCAVRTTNKYFDFGLSKRFTDNRPLLISKLLGKDEAAQTSGKEAVSEEPAA